jgi:hypothetical protein
MQEALLNNLATYINMEHLMRLDYFPNPYSFWLLIFRLLRILDEKFFRL